MAVNAEERAAEFDAAMRRAGIVVPEERRAAMLTGYEELRGQIDLLRQERSEAAEPSNVFRLAPR
jgi:hypothetical protein